MSEPELINPVDPDDARAWGQSLATTFLGTAYGDDFDRMFSRWSRTWCAERTWGARDRGRWVATLVTCPLSLTVPGPDGGTADLDVDGVTAVTVSATHRRRGLLTGMLGECLRTAKDRGDAASILIASEWPIYGRYGYAPATARAAYRYHPKRPGGAVGSPSGVRQVDAAELSAVAPAVFDAARRQRAGQIDRPHPWWDRRLGLDGYLAVGGETLNWFVHEGAEGPDGVLAWEPTRSFDLSGPTGVVSVSDLIAVTDEAYRELWAYLSGLDLVGEIALRNRPVDEPARWLLGDGRALVQGETQDFLWLRLLDVPAALSARSYAVAGSVVLDVLDADHGGYAAGRVALEVDRVGRAVCTPTTAPADIRLSHRALASSYLGGNSLRGRKVLGDVAELTPGAVNRLDLMFTTALAPWTQTGF